MRLDKFTVKAQEALQAAQALADQRRHQAIEPEHLLAALLEQREGVVGPVLAKLGARPEAIQGAITTELAKWPAVSGGGGQYPGAPVRQAGSRAAGGALPRPPPPRPPPRPARPPAATARRGTGRPRRSRPAISRARS